MEVHAFLCRPLLPDSFVCPDRLETGELADPIGGRLTTLPYAFGALHLRDRAVNRRVKLGLGNRVIRVPLAFQN